MTQQERTRTLTEAAHLWMGTRQVGLARAPGRVNLIGEHTDYNGAPVMPLAVEQDILGVWAPRSDSTVRIRDWSGVFGERSFALTTEIPPFPTGDFGNYAKAAVQGLITHEQQKQGPREFQGFDLLVHGTIPPAAGMSSSSALVVLVGLVFAAVNHLEYSRLELASLMATAERYVGTQGGGMDQAASLNGQKGKVVKIDFFPLRVRPVPLVADAVLLVADTLVKAPKTESALYEYNRRSLECRLAARVLDAHLADRVGHPIVRLGDLPLTDVGAEQVLAHDAWTYQNIAQAVGRSTEEVRRLYGVDKVGRPVPEPAEGFKLLSRFRHVMNEWNRVENAVTALEAGDLSALGRLMNESHASCRDLHEVSCSELDELSAEARRAGAWGSRMTGAGFGGCTVSLVPRDAVDDVKEHLSRTYYARRPNSSVALFVARPSDGASILSTPGD